MKLHHVCIGLCARAFCFHQEAAALTFTPRIYHHRGLGSLLQLFAEKAVTMPEPEWDAENGVWKGAIVPQAEEIPNPLWIFGYGSLLWRPEQGWEDFENSIAFVRGYKRLFAQNSCDHRGTPSFPGLVVTLVSDEDLERLGSRDKNSDPSETLGVVYRIPNEKSQAILEDLDFREKGGYSRSVVDVTTPEGRSIRALLYAGTVDNPNFNLCNDLNRVAEIIHTAHGPSGPNKEYLFKLADFLREAGNHDDHVMSLDESVRLLESSAK